MNRKHKAYRCQECRRFIPLSRRVFPKHYYHAWNRDTQEPEKICAGTGQKPMEQLKGHSQGRH